MSAEYKRKRGPMTFVTQCSTTLAWVDLQTKLGRSKETFLDRPSIFDRRTKTAVACTRHENDMRSLEDVCDSSCVALCNNVQLLLLAAKADRRAAVTRTLRTVSSMSKRADHKRIFCIALSGTTSPSRSFRGVMSRPPVTRVTRKELHAYARCFWQFFAYHLSNYTVFNGPFGLAKKKKIMCL